MTLSQKERCDLAAILDLLSEHLESAIEGEIIPNTGGLMNGTPGRGRARQVQRDRKDWRRVEDWKIRLQEGR